MKKLISLLCAAVMLVGVLAVGAAGASAADSAEAAQTIVDVKAGDEVTYTLSLEGVPEKVIGCDFSAYYDSDVFTVEKIADFTGSYDEDDWQALINPDLDGEVRGNWSILRGIDFSEKRTLVSLVLKAKSEAKAHLSYYVRYLYGNSAFESDSRPQISDYVFTCDVLVNGEAVLEEARPELNVDEPQDIGTFINSKTGDSKDADVNIADDTSDSKGSSGSNNSGSNSSGNNGGSGSNGGNTSETAADGVPAATEIQQVIVEETDAQGNVVATTVVETAQPASGGSSPVIWVVIALVVVAAGCGGAYYLITNKKKNTPQ